MLAIRGKTPFGSRCLSGRWSAVFARVRIMQVRQAGKAGRQRRLSRQKGVTALEYGILAAIVAVVIGATVFTNLSDVLSSAFSNVTSAATSAATH